MTTKQWLIGFFLSLSIPLAGAAEISALRVNVDVSACPALCMPWEVVQERQMPTHQLPEAPLSWVALTDQADLTLKLLPDRIQILPLGMELVADQRLHAFDGGLRQALATALIRITKTRKPALAALPVTEAADKHLLGEPLRAWMLDFSARLSQQRQLSVIQADGSSHSWSPARDVFSTACQAQLSNCLPLLQAQYDRLSVDWRKVNPEQGLGLRETLLISALTDVCQMAGFGDMGYRCLPRNKQNMPKLAALGWQLLGYDALFVAYDSIASSEQNSWRGWVEHESNLSPAQVQTELKALEPTPTSMRLSAELFEASDNLGPAFSGWLTLLSNRLPAKDYPVALTAIVNLARLSALQGKQERAEQWWQVGQQLLAEHPDLQTPSQCLLQSQRLILDVEKARLAATPFAGAERIQTLIDQDCSFTAASLHFALYALASQQQETAVDVLRRAQNTCLLNQNCGHDRQEALGQLLLVASGSLNQQQQAAKTWLQRLDNGPMLRLDFQVAWTLAEQLRRAGDLTTATRLYQALDERLDLRRNQVSATDLDDIARYDELKRLRVRLSVEQGELILPASSEKLRSQRLLRRLMMERWHKELAGVKDVTAEKARDQQLADIKTARQQLTKLSGEFGRAYAAAFNELLQDGETLAQMQYLGTLLAKKEGHAATYAWTSLEIKKSISEGFDVFNAPVTSLRDDDAYLSWLRVPGGYVATLLAVDPDNQQSPGWISNMKIQQRFIPFNEQDETLLQLYRQLLQVGTLVDRGETNVLPVSLTEDGVLLNGQPLWLMPDGHWQTAAQAPANGMRLQRLEQISEVLYQRLLAPLEGHYPQAKRLFISPDGPLAYLPFETLSHHGKPVLDDLDISYVQSLEVFAELKKRAASSKTSSQSLLTLADPKFPAPDLLAAGTGSLQRLGRLSWRALPGTRKESTAIARLYPRHQQLLGAKASKATLEKLRGQQQLEQFKVLHFATHGYVDDERSALILTPDTAPLSAYLMDQDILQWQLHSDLVVLSACNTGIGRQLQGEGVVGLPYAFFMAGNLNTLMSLWPVDDVGTATFIPAFMQRVKAGEDHVTALNHTKRAFARGDYGQTLRNPRVWSAFVLYGVPKH